MAIPIYYQEMNLLMGRQIPSALSYDSVAFNYFWRSLYDRLRSRFNIDCPDDWDKEAFAYMLLGAGYTPLVDTNKFANNTSEMYGIIPVYGTPTGIGVLYQPTKFIIANPLLPNIREVNIWEDAGMVRLTSDWMGLFDIIDKYAATLATLEGTINQSIINSRFAYVLAAKNNNAAKTIKAIMDARSQGKPYMVFDKEMFKDISKGSKTDVLTNDDMFEFIDFRVRENYITKDLLADMTTIYHQFDMEVGIPSNPAEKAERLVTNEVESNNVESVARFTTWMENLNTSIKKSKKLFPELKLSITPTVYYTGQTGAKESGKEVKDVREDNPTGVK